MDPKLVICDQCKKPFETIVEGETTCVQCLIKPSHRDPVIQRKQEPIAMSSKPTYKPKNCIACKNEFVPTGACQKRCPNCMGRPHRATAIVAVTENTGPNPPVIKTVGGQQIPAVLPMDFIQALKNIVTAPGVSSVTIETDQVSVCLKNNKI